MTANLNAPEFAIEKLSSKAAHIIAQNDAAVILLKKQCQTGQDISEVSASEWGNLWKYNPKMVALSLSLANVWALAPQVFSFSEIKEGGATRDPHGTGNLLRGSTLASEGERPD